MDTTSDNARKNDAREEGNGEVSFTSPIRQLSAKDIALVAGGEDSGPKKPGIGDNQARAFKV